MISPKRRTSSVKKTANRGISFGESTAAARAPATDAPAVLAMVLSVRMAEMGLATLLRR